jgi:hypothetical protein
VIGRAIFDLTVNDTIVATVIISKTAGIAIKGISETISACGRLGIAVVRRRRLRHLSLEMATSRT